jgi:hypothetical protein
MPEDLGEIPTPSSENEEIAAVGIALQAFLNLQGETLHAPPHISMARRDPHTASCGKRDQLRSAFKVAATKVGEAFAQIRMRAVFISIRCEFRFNPAGDSDLIPATIPI